MKPNFFSAFKHTSLTSDAVTYQPYYKLDQTMVEFLCNQGDMGAMEEIAESYYSSEDPAILKKAVELFKLGAEKGNQDAMFMMANCYFEGNGVPQSYEDYFAWLQKAADNGSWMAARNMATAYFRGKDHYEGFGFDQDHGKALEWSITAAELILCNWEYFTQPNFEDFGDTTDELVDNYAKLAETIARHYQFGKGVEQSTEMAIQWLEKGNDLVVRATGCTWSYFDGIIEKLKATMK